MADLTGTKEQLTAELFPPEGDPKLGFRIFEVLSEVIDYKARLGLPDKWNRFYELGKNKHWRGSTNRATLISANLLHTHRSRTVNMLTDNNPTFNVRQVGEVEEEQKEEIFDTLLRTAEFWWGDQEQQAVLEKSILNGETYGCCVEKILFNPALEYGIGEVETEVVDPYYFGFYPVKCTDIQKAEAVFHYWPMTVREARRRWPDKAKDIQADMEFLNELGDERIEVTSGSRGNTPRGYLSTFGGIVKNMLNVASGSSELKDYVLVCEVWVKDLTRTRKGNKEYDKYYGNIRCIQTCTGGKVILSDRNNPSINPTLPIEQASKTYLFDKFPFTFTQSNTDTTNPWGMSDMEQLESLQLEIDKTMSQFTLVKDKVSRIKIINPRDSGVANEKFTNEPGIINPSSTATSQGIRYMEPPPIPADLVKALEIYKEYFMLVGSIFELEQAKDEGRNVIAYKAIAALLERASTMLKGKIRNYSKMIRERGRMYLSHVMNWYTEDRWISYDEEGDETTKSIRGPNLIVPAKLSVVSGSTMPVSRIQEREEALSLFQQGAIDAQALLEKLDWTNRKQIISRMKMGPIGNFTNRLVQIGAASQTQEVFNMIAELDDKEFDRHMQKGEIPPFQAIVQPSMGGQQNQISPEQAALQMESQSKVMETEAKIQEIQAKAELIKEQTNTEKVNQAAVVAGINFDREKLVIERAKFVKDMENADREMVFAREDKTRDEIMQREDREETHGLERERMDREEKLEKEKLDRSEQLERDQAEESNELEREKLKTTEKIAATKSTNKTSQGPYREKGMKSNNKK